MSKFTQSLNQHRCLYANAIAAIPSVFGPDWYLSLSSLNLSDRLHQKQGRAIARYQILPHLSVYIKRVDIYPGYLNILARWFPWVRWSVSVREWRNLCQAHRLGLNVPRPIAVAELLTPSGSLQSFLAVEELYNMLPLHLAIPEAALNLPPSIFTQWKRSLLAAIINIVSNLHHQGYFHKDLYLCHFYIPQQCLTLCNPNWQHELHLIDFHRFNRHRLSSVWWRMKDLAQLLFSMHIDGLTHEDRSWALDEYLRGLPPTLRSLIRIVIHLRIQNYLRHQVKYQR